MLFLYSKFKKRKWVKLNNKKKLQVYQALENKFAKKQHREPLTIVIHESSLWKCLGMFTNSNNNPRIIIHENLLIQDNMRFHGMETILHEGRHAYQLETISKPLPWYAFKAKKWQKNWIGYVPSAESDTIYNNQAVEQDAQKYALKIMLNLFDKYSEEKDYLKTIKINKYRLEHANDSARKQFGIFYKHKIDKIINKKLENNLK